MKRKKFLCDSFLMKHFVTSSNIHFQHLKINSKDSFSDRSNGKNKKEEEEEEKTFFFFLSIGNFGE